MGLSEHQAKSELVSINSSGDFVVVCSLNPLFVDPTSDVTCTSTFTLSRTRYSVVLTPSTKV